MNHFSIYSKGEDKKYNLTQEQYKLYNHLSDEFKGLLIRNFMISILALFIGLICMVLLIFQYTRKCAFICLIVTFLLRTFHYLYVNYRGKQISVEINALLKPLEIK
jgi:hypothetical protein